MRNIVEILVVLVFFVFPSIFISSDKSVNELPSFSIVQILYYSVLCAYFFIRSKMLNSSLFGNSEKSPKSKKCKKVFRYVGFSLLTIIFLFANGVFWQKVSGLEQLPFSFPNKLFDFAQLIVGLFVFAFFEESLFRFFLPLSAKSIFIKKIQTLSKQKQIFVNLLIEAAIVALFSLCHRYLSLFAVANAFFAGLALRFLSKKMPSLFLCATVHFLYNLCCYLF